MTLAYHIQIPVFLSFFHFKPICNILAFQKLGGHTSSSLLIQCHFQTIFYNFKNLEAKFMSPFSSAAPSSSPQSPKHLVQFSTKSGFSHLSAPVVKKDIEMESDNTVLPPKKNWKDTAVRKNKQQKKKRREGNNEKNTLKASRPWPDLPPQLIRSISKQLSLMQHCSFICVTKGWRSSFKQCNNISKQQFPWLELITDQRSRDTHYVYNVPLAPEFNAWWYDRYPPMYPRDSQVFGFTHGKLLMETTKSHRFSDNEKPFKYHFWIPPRSNSFLPPFEDDHVPVGHIVLAPLSDSKYCSFMTLVLTGCSKPSFMFLDRSQSWEFQWAKEECKVLDPNASPSNPCAAIQFTNAIGFKGKFYALSLQGTLAVIDLDSHPKVTILRAKRAIPSTWSRWFKEHLVESCGEILLVFLISRKSIQMIDDIEVYRLDFDSVEWVKMESLGDDRTLFVSANCCMPVSAREVGCKSNCVYLKQEMVDGWWIFDINGGTISPGWDADCIDKSPTWTSVVPIME